MSAITTHTGISSLKLPDRQAVQEATKKLDGIQKWAPSILKFLIFNMITPVTLGPERVVVMTDRRGKIQLDEWGSVVMEKLTPASERLSNLQMRIEMIVDILKEMDATEYTRHLNDPHFAKKWGAIRNDYEQMIIRARILVEETRTAVAANAPQTEVEIDQPDTMSTDEDSEDSERMDSAPSTPKQESFVQDALEIKVSEIDVVCIEMDGNNEEWPSIDQLEVIDDAWLENNTRKVNAAYSALPLAEGVIPAEIVSVTTTTTTTESIPQVPSYTVSIDGISYSIIPCEIPPSQLPGYQD